jgi:hypothetical protein
MLSQISIYPHFTDAALATTENPFFHGTFPALANHLHDALLGWSGEEATQWKQH